MEQIFYVKDKAGNLWPAKFLYYNGQPVIDPNTSTAQNTPIFNANGTQISNANPNAYLIVPEDYSVQQLIDGPAGAVKDAVTVQTLGLGGAETIYGYPIALGEIASGFYPGNQYDLQHTYDGGQHAANASTFVPAFTDITSFDIGLFAGYAGIPLNITLAMTGVFNEGNDLKQLILGNTRLNTSGLYGNPPVNVNSQIAGYNFGRTLPGANTAALENPSSITIEGGSGYSYSSAVVSFPSSNQMDIVQNFNAGGSESDNFTYNSDGSETEVTAAYSEVNLGGTLEYTQTTTTSSSGQTTAAAITGTGDDAALSSVAVALAAGATVGIAGIGNAVTLASGSTVSDSPADFATDSITFDVANGGGVTIDPGTFAAASQYTDSGTVNIPLVFADPIPLGTLSLNPSNNTDTFTLTDGTVLSLPGITANDTITPVSSSDTPLQALDSYLTDLGFNTSNLSEDYFNALYPSGAPTPPSGSTLNIDDDTVTLTSEELADYQSVVGTQGTIDAIGGGAFDLTAANVDSGVQANLTAQTWEGTQLTGNDAADETLTASLFGNDTLTAGSGNSDVLVAGDGNDTLTAGNGTGDQLYAGGGVDSISGGTGGDSFYAYDGLASGSTVTGSGTGNTLVANDDISGATISGIQTLKIALADGNNGDITLTAGQFNGFTSITSGVNDLLNGTISAASGGTYDLADETSLGYDMTALSNSGTTLIGNSANDETLTASATGNDTLEAGSGQEETLIAGGGVDTLVAGSGSNSSFLATNGLAAGSVVEGNSSNPSGYQLDASGDISGATITNVDSLDLTGGNSVTMTGAQFNAFNGHMSNANYESSSGDYEPGAISITTAGTYDLDTGDSFDLTALSNGGTTLEENGLSTALVNGVTLTASSSGNDTLSSSDSSDVLLDASGSSGNDTLYTASGTENTLDAGDTSGTVALTGTGGLDNTLDATYSTGAVTLNGVGDTGDFLFAGDGTDTLYDSLGGTSYGGGGTDTFYVNSADTVYGGSGNDTFIVNFPLFAGTSITGGTGSNTLTVNGVVTEANANDISLAAITGVQTLNDNATTLGLTASELSGFTNVENASGSAENIAADTAGTYSLAAENVTGNFNLITSPGLFNVTLIGNSQNNQILAAGAGTDTLEAGSGTGDVLIGGTGTTTFVLGGTGAQTQISLANPGITFAGGVELLAFADPDTVEVQSGQTATIQGSDGTMTVTNNVSGVEANTINWTAGGSEKQEFSVPSGTTFEEQDQGYSGANGTGTQLWTDTIIDYTNGTLDADIAGTGETFALSGAAGIDVASNSTATLTGSNNTVQLNNNDTITFGPDANNDFAWCGNDDVVTFQGTDERFVAYGGGNTVNLNGNSNVDQDDSADDGDNSPGGNNFAVNGNDNQVSLAVDGDLSTVTGNGNTVIARASSDTITVSGGTGNFAEDVGSGNTITLDGTSNEAGIGPSSTLTMGGSGNSGYSGNDSTVTVGGTSDSFVAYGDDNTIDLTGTSASSIDYGSGSGSNTYSVTGASDTLSLLSNDTVTLSGNGDSATLHGSGTAVTLTGTGDSVTDRGTGSNTITLGGSSNVANVYGSQSDTLTVGGSGDALAVNNNITGTSTATISGSNAQLIFRGSTTDNIVFSGSSIEELILGSAASFAGTVAGMGSSDSIDLGNFQFSNSPTISSVTGTGASGTYTDVTVSDNGASVQLQLLNQYANQFAVSASAYTLASDATGSHPGTLFELAAGH